MEIRENYCATIIDNGTEGIDRQMDQKEIEKGKYTRQTKKVNALFKRSVSSQDFHIYRLQDICQETNRNPSGSPDFCKE